MAYAKLSSRDVQNWDHEYDDLQKKSKFIQLIEEQRQNDQQIAELEEKIEQRLNQDIRTAKRYLGQHQQQVDKWLSAAQTDLMHAKDALAAYKKDPAKKQQKDQLHHFAVTIAGYGTAMDNDVRDLAEAWLDYRDEPVQHAPASRRTTFNAIRGEIINSQKGDTVKRVQIEAAQHQVEAMLAVEQKATLKAGIKAGTGQQRAIGVAQQAARDVDTQMTNLLNLISNPPDLTPAPASVSTSAANLVKYAGKASWYDTPGNLGASRGLWSKVEQGYKLFSTKAASMEKTLALKKKSFRSGELSDATVKAELAKAETKVKQAKTIVKSAEADYKKGKTAMDKLEAGFKKKKKK